MSTDAQPLEICHCPLKADTGSASERSIIITITHDSVCARKNEVWSVLQTQSYTLEQYCLFATVYDFITHADRLCRRG